MNIMDKSISNENSNQDLLIIKTKVRSLVGKGTWKKIMKLINNGKFTNLNVEIDNDNNIFHLACIKGKTSIIHELIKLKREGKIILNTNLLNGDGLPGIYLYYKYGGTDTSFLNEEDVCYIDNSSHTLANYLMDRINALEILIDKMFEKGCIDNTELPDHEFIYVELIKKINEHSSKNEHDKEKNLVTKNRYLNIIRKLYVELKSSVIVFVAIHLNCLDVITMLIMLDFDFMIYSLGKVTPLTKALDTGHIEIALMILEYTKIKFGNYAVYKMIHASEKSYNYRPIFVAIVTQHYTFISTLINYMIPYMKEKYDKDKIKIMFKNEIDNGHNTYLHKLLNIRAIENIPQKVLKFFIEHTDLNQENYAGVTPAHLLINKQLWKTFRNILIDREIDLLKIDNIGNNCYSYVKPEDTIEFLEFTKSIKIPIQIKNSTELEKIFENDDVKTVKGLLDKNTNIEVAHIGSKSYGLFNANLIHYMLYLRYLENKYKSLYVPIRDYSDSGRERDLFLYSLSTYNTSPKQILLNRQILPYIDIFYSYLPHEICWIDKDQYFVDNNLINILRSHDSKISVDAQRYIMIKLTIVVTETLLHANVLLYDRLNREAWRFEPYGVTNIGNLSLLDQMLHEVLEKVYGKISYNDPDNYLHGLNFQLVDGEDYVQNQNLGDPGGYCLAWSMWFIDVVLANPDKNVKNIMRNFFSRHSISTIISEEEGEQIISSNYYLDFIRRYAHKLDNDKNKILLSLGVKKYYLYNIIMQNDVLEKIKAIFKINPKTAMIVADSKSQNITISSDSSSDVSSESSE